MAKVYYEQLNDLVNRLKLSEIAMTQIEAKHFFSGAALYSNGIICASLSPMGLAFKLSEMEVNKLIGSEKAVPFKYFAKGNVKKGYALFQSPELSARKWKSYFKKAFAEVAFKH